LKNYSFCESIHYLYAKAKYIFYIEKVDAWWMHYRPRLDATNIIISMTH